MNRNLRNDANWDVICARSSKTGKLESPGCGTCTGDGLE